MIPEKPSLDALDAKWSARWEAAGTYRFDRSKTRSEVYSIDTPPPTVSGTLHVGHVFSYTHTDIIARYQRMRGREVFYPIGWDDNGLPTERRAQNHFGVRCDPTLPYDPSFEPPGPGGRVPVSRRNFIELCEEITAADEEAYEDLWRRLGLSVDWSMTYTTIGARARRVAQRAFLRALAAGEAYQAEAPTAWDTDFGTAVAQAEQVDKEVPGAYHTLRFGSGIVVETTRPELLPACVALVAHPTDSRYQGLFGTQVEIPLFGRSVTVHPHELADPEKGTGIAMVCTFGDATDVIWWRELKLDTRVLIGRDGRFGAPFEGLTVKQARARVVELLRESGDLIGEPRAITHPVRFYENGDRPLEIVSSRQWFYRTLAHTDWLAARGQELQWHPAHMRVRYDHWVAGLNADWLISRQRHFGVPFPVWYPIGADGRPDHSRPLVPTEAELPVDPATDCPAGFTEADRGVRFVADPDVMDTWATSSLTPRIACGWVDDEDLYARTYPMDLRAQAHEIIRTWLFTSVLRDPERLPWGHAAISGWILDPDRKKMGKSLGNALGPAALLDEYGSDGARYWAAQGRLGVDTLFDPAQMRVGRRLATKLLNVGRFVLSLPSPAPDAEATATLDRALLARLAATVAECTAALDSYEHTRALNAAETFLWTFCDDYLELVKERAYAGDGSAAVTLRAGLDGALRLLAPFLPFATEEVWSWTHEGSVHRAAWPTADGFRAPEAGFGAAGAPEAGGAAGGGPVGDDSALVLAAEVIAAVRKAKSTARVSMRTPVAELVVSGAELAADLLADVVAAGRVESVVLVPGDAVAVEVRL
ncbi:valine--tRNA ligase [Longispora sp. K20-0274]|uniref:valine--tRNA ligase n=1 Tax=Longispora sp. K20-0274 TaxID=3088255 RepID=UPI00399957EC